MASEVKVECSLNTTECILETIASILSEIQEQNNEYNWDPLTFLFTAIIGVIAIIFAALTAFQAFLAAGPGRIKSGPYSIGPWSRHNHRRFHWTEMRFRTTSSTPILTADSLNWGLLKDNKEGSGRHDEDPGRLRKRKNDYFPATWLALLTQLSLDYTKLWEDMKLTGADYIPSEFSAVPAYGSIGFVTILAMVLSRGFGRLTIDRESGLPRVRARSFNLIFRQHPLLGAIGFFEMYGKMDSEDLDSQRQTHTRLLQAHGHMSLPGFKYSNDEIKENTMNGWMLTFNEFEFDNFITPFAATLRQKCPHRDQEPTPACLNLLKFFTRYDAAYFLDGPLYLLIADIPKREFLPFLFPHKKAKLRERLDTLLLQSRFWGMESVADCDLLPNSSANITNDKLSLIGTVTSWAQSIEPDINKLNIDKKAYALCSAYLKENSTQENEYDYECRTNQYQLQFQLESIDLWLKQIEPHVLCRKLTLSVIGDRIRQMVDTVQQQPILEVSSHAKNATVPSNSHRLSPVVNGKLDRFLEAMAKPNGFDSLYLFEWSSSTQSPMVFMRDTYEGLTRIRDIWEMEESSLKDKVSEEGGGTDESREHKTHAWKLPHTTVHPLDDVLIYRAVLMTLLYCLSNDSSDLMDEDKYGLIVPIM
jgi:hypothetical protein